MQAQADDAVVADARQPQPVREPVAAPVETAERHPGVACDHGDIVRMVVRPRRDELVRALDGGRGDFRSVALREQLTALRGKKQRDVVNPLVGIGGQRAQEPAPERRHIPSPRLVKKIRAVHEPAPDRRPVLDQVELKVELGGHGLDRDRFHARRSAVPTGQRGVLVGEQDLEERIAGQTSIWAQGSYDPLEGDRLVREGVKARRGHPVQEVAEGRVSRHVGPQRDGVDEVPDQGLELGERTARDRGPDHDVRAAAQPRKQHAEGCVQHHEARRAFCFRECAQRAHHVRGQRHGHRRAAVGLLARPGPVGDQAGVSRQVVQVFDPVVELGLCRLLGVGSGLPDREVRVLRRERRELGGAAFGRRGVELGHLAHQHTHRPQV